MAQKVPTSETRFRACRVYHSLWHLCHTRALSLQRHMPLLWGLARVPTSPDSPVSTTGTSGCRCLECAFSTKRGKPNETRKEKRKEKEMKRRCCVTQASALQVVGARNLHKRVCILACGDCALKRVKPGLEPLSPRA